MTYMKQYASLIQCGLLVLYPRGMLRRLVPIALVLFHGVAQGIQDAQTYGSARWKPASGPSTARKLRVEQRTIPSSSMKVKAGNEVSLIDLAEFEHVASSASDGEHATSGAIDSKESVKNKGVCTVPKHAESTVGHIFGGRHSFCYNEQAELQNGEACDTACPKFYKTPTPQRIWCHCDEATDACSLQPVVSSPDDAPVMMNFGRCPISPFRLGPLLVLFLVLPYLAYLRCFAKEPSQVNSIYMAQQPTRPKPETADVLIIGAGISGCWLADQLKSKRPDLKVLIVEASDRIGGRLKSDENNGEKARVRDELGGMRIFPEKMPKITALVNRFGLDLVAQPLDDSTNLFHYRGITTQKQNSAMPAGGSWAGQHPLSMSEAAVDAYKKTQFWDQCREDAFACPELRSLSVSEFFVKYANASPEEIAYWFAYSGYNLHHDDVQSSIFVDNKSLYSSVLTEHHFVRQGFEHVAHGLIEASGYQVLLNTKATAIQKEGATLIATLTAWPHQVEASRVIVGVTAKQIREIAGLNAIISPPRFAALDASKPISLFKCFLDFKIPWWQKHGFKSGKTTTDTDARQIHYYDDDDILVYCSDGDGRMGADYASSFHRELESNRAAPLNMRLRRMFDIVKKVHMDAGIPEEDIIEPTWDKCVYKYWPGGSHKWKKGADVRACMSLIADGSNDGSQVYIVGDAFSVTQGWVEGAIDIAELAFAKAFL